MCGWRGVGACMAGERGAWLRGHVWLGGMCGWAPPLYGSPAGDKHPTGMLPCLIIVVRRSKISQNKGNVLFAKARPIDKNY